MKKSNQSALLRIRMGLFTASLLLALLAFEVAVRLVGVDFNPNPNWRFHSTLGWTQEKSMEYQITVDGDPVRIQFNSIGFRDVEHTLEKPRGTRRIVLLGDSFSEAIQVNLEETYWHRLQTLLNRNSVERWEVINLGVGDWGNAQAYLALTQIGLDYSPDLVISQIFPLNDICNNTIELAGLCKSQNDLYRPYFVDSPQGLKIAHVQSIRHFLRRNLVTFGVLEKALMVARQQSQGQSVEELHQMRIRERGLPGDPLLFTYARDGAQIGPVSKGWQITELILQKTEEECRKRGIPWVPVVIPFEARVGPGWDRFAQSFTNIEMEQDYPEKRLGRLFRQMGVPHVFLKPVFEEHSEAFFPGRGGHLNPVAHQLAAQAIHEALADSSLLERITSGEDTDNSK